MVEEEEEVVEVLDDNLIRTEVVVAVDVVLTTVDMILVSGGMSVLIMKVIGVVVDTNGKEKIDLRGFCL